MDPAVVAAMVWLEVHTLDGRTVIINSEEIISFAQPNKEKGLWTDAARCLITLTDAKFVTVKETCDEVRSRLNE
jgi:uncharacterized protein YlzI (FlbEa/FlbD family)